MAKYRVTRDPVVQPQDQSIKYISLTKRQIAIVDACEYYRAMELNWCAAYRKSIDGYYAVAWTILPDGTRKQIFLHHFIVGNATPHVDHEDGNGLNNTRKNLRPCSHSQNHANMEKRVDNTSGYKGVSWSKQKRDWESYCTFQGKKQHFGHYKDKDDAARAYNDGVLRLFGKFAKLNHIP